MMGGRGGPFQLPNAAAAQQQRQKKAARQQVKGWVLATIPEEVRGDATVEVSEVQCGDPNCSPVDTAVRIYFPKGTHLDTGFPLEVEEVTQEDILEEMPPPDVWFDLHQGVQRDWPPPPDPGEPPAIALRFPVGSRVECRIGPASDPNGGWGAGTVAMHWYRQAMWPTGQFAPYQIQLDQGPLIFAPRDSDTCIRAAGSGAGEGPVDQADFDDEEEYEDDEEELANANVQRTTDL